MAKPNMKACCNTGGRIKNYLEKPNITEILREELLMIYCDIE